MTKSLDNTSVLYEKTTENIAKVANYFEIRTIISVRITHIFNEFMDIEGLIDAKRVQAS